MAEKQLLECNATFVLDHVNRKMWRSNKPLVFKFGEKKNKMRGKHYHISTAVTHMTKSLRVSLRMHSIVMFLKNMTIN